MNENAPIRNRIVINLDDRKSTQAAQRQSARSSKRWPKILAFLAGFIIVGVVLAAFAGFLWWRHYQTTPAYSLALIVDAAQRNQMDTFAKQIDDDEIAKRMVSDVTQKAASRYGLALTGSLQTEVTKLIPTVLPKVKETIHQEVAAEIKEFASKTQPKPFIIVALAIPTFAKITTEGDTAKASAKLNDREITIGMQRDGSLWKVVEVNDDVLLQRIVDNVIKEFPAIGRDFGNIDLLRSATTKPTKKR